MKQKKYSAGAVKYSFWFMEFRKMVGLLNDGQTIEDLKKMNQEQNIFGASTPKRSKEMFNAIAARISTLPPSFYPLFLGSDIATQKAFVLIAVMAYDTLFFDFVYEVIRDKMIIGSNEYTDGDMRIFFRDKQVQDEIVATWTEATTKRLGSSYKTMLLEAGMTDKGKGTRKIQKIIMDPLLERWLIENGMEPMIYALTGVR